MSSWKIKSFYCLPPNLDDHLWTREPSSSPGVQQRSSHTFGAKKKYRSRCNEEAPGAVWLCPSGKAKGHDFSFRGTVRLCNSAGLPAAQDLVTEAHISLSPSRVLKVNEIRKTIHKIEQNPNLEYSVFCLCLNLLKRGTVETWNAPE